MSKSSDKRKFTLSGQNTPGNSEQEAAAIKRLDQPCPCQSGNTYRAKTYRECCRLYHKRQLVPPYTEPPTAEGLMRSRYTAFAMGLTDYLMDTTHREHPEYRSNVRLWRKELQTYCDSTQFHGLVILECEERERNLATVTFRAHLERQGQRFILQEKSVFVMIGTRWLYFAGETSTIQQEPDPSIKL